MGCPVGTEVEVKNLFYNIPVKRKFLKSIRSELRHSLNHFLRVEPFPSVRFPANSFMKAESCHEYLKTESPMVRVEAILGREIYDHLQAIEFEEGEIRISGFASLPSIFKGKWRWDLSVCQSTIYKRPNDL